MKRVSDKKVGEIRKRTASFKKKAEIIVRKFQNNKGAAPNPDKDQERIILDNIREKMDVYNDRFRSRMQNDKIKGGPLKLAESVPKISQHKFDMHKNYQRELDPSKTQLDPNMNKYNYESALLQLNSKETDLSNLEKEEYIKNMPFPDHFMNSLKTENAQMRDNFQRKLKELDKQRTNIFEE